MRRASKLPFQKPSTRPAAALVLAVASLVTASAATSASPPPAQLAFIAGHQIGLINSDGSGRILLTRDPKTTSAYPAWSPDGTEIAFVRAVTDSGEDGRARIWLMDAHGARARAITPAVPRVTQLTPAWSPDGQRLAYARLSYNRNTLIAQIVAIDRGGGQERVLFEETVNPDDETLRTLLVYIGSPAWSPDGGRVLFTRVALDRRAYFRPSLGIVNADGTGRKTLAGDAGEGSWSPDGARIAFVSVRDRNGEDCGEDQCSYNGEIYVMNADGTQPHRLTNSKASDGNPAWSPDGGRIAFASNRNYPSGYRAELYSMKPDGSCLTWLTNGTASSFYPAWRPASGSSDSGVCGATNRPPLVETDTSAATSFRRHRLYWLGEVTSGGMLLSDVSNTGESFTYGDCAHYDPAPCSAEIQLQEGRACSGHVFFDLGLHPRIFKRRGALVHIPANRDQAVEIYTGRVEIRIFLDRRDLPDVIAQLRPVGKESVGGSLPGAALPSGLWRSLRRNAATVRRFGSTGAAAHRLKTSRLTVRKRLALLRKLRSLGQIGKLRCRGRALP